MAGTLLLLAAFAVGGDAHPDGSLMILQNSKKIVSHWIDSEFTHVALLMNFGGDTWVYEAAPASVKRIRLNTYRREIARYNDDGEDATRIWVMHPRVPLTKDESRRLWRYLEEQVDRPYSVRGYLRKEPGPGVHCAELAATGLKLVKRTDQTEVYLENPSTLVQGIQPHFEPPVEITALKYVSRSSWYERSKESLADYFNWCGWACGESWSWCW